jgi:hypothetical protein
MARTLTPERKKLRQDAIRIRQELGWSERRIAEYLGLDPTTTHRFVKQYTLDKVKHNHRLLHKGDIKTLHNSHLTLNQVYIMPCEDGMAKLPHESIDLVFADPPYNIGVD